MIPTAAKENEVTPGTTPTAATTIPWWEVGVPAIPCKRWTCTETTTTAPTAAPTTTPYWSCDRDSRFTCIDSTPDTTPLVSTTTATGQTVLPITVVEYPHLIYEIETKASDYVIMGLKKFRIRCKCPRSDPDRACDWYQSDIKFTEEFLNNLRCDPPGELPTIATTTQDHTSFQNPTTLDVTTLGVTAPDVTTPASDST